MAVDAFDDSQFLARVFFDSEPPFALHQSLGVDMALAATYFLDLLPMVATCAVLEIGLPMILTG